MAERQNLSESQGNIADVSGTGNKVFQNVSGTVTDQSVNTYVTQIIDKSLDYQDLMQRLEKQRRRVERLQTAGDIEGAIEEAAELETLEKRLDDLKEDVFRLYEIFTKIEINTERLVKAKAYFEQGQFREADAILNAEAMTQDLARVIERDEQLDQDYAQQKADIAQHRTQLADEFLIKARLQALTYDQSDWFERACAYFETALKAARNLTTLFEYALFLQNHNCFDQAQPLYHELLESSRGLAAENPRTYLPDVAMTLNNLANLQSDQNDFERALASYEEALQIRRGLAAENPRTYLPYVATTLNNLAVLQSDQNDFERALASYEEALQIRRGLAAENPRTYLPYVATTLNNLAVLQSDQNDFERALASYEEALQMYRGLAAENPRTYLPYVATTLNNLAVLQSAQNDFERALASYEEALQIRRGLAAENPRTYLPYVAGTLINVSIFYLQAKPNAERAIALATEVLEIAQDFQHVPRVMRDAAKAVQVLQANGVDLTQAEPEP
jgi:tetratricopeptide (TPR) repeat protein/tetrahydromethanopterin S-methyltransferase subunit G